MASDHPSETRLLWRGGGNASPREPLVPGAFGIRVLLVTTGLLLAVAAAAGMFSWLVGTPETHFVSCWVTTFRDPALSPNPAANCDRLALQKGNYFARSDVASMPVHSRFLMTQQLDALAENSRSENVVLYVGTYAIVDGDGKIILLTSDYGPGQPASGLPLAKVLQSLKKSPARHKLLILDISWGNLLPSITGGAGDVAAALPKELGAVPDPDRLVLSSCSPGQTALTSETLGRSVFSYYFEQALRGDADRYNSDHLEDGRVTVREAAQLVAARVDRWAMQNRACRQTPMLLGKGKDFELTVCRVAPLTAPVPTKLPKYPDWLLAGWKLREQWEADGTSRLAPHLFRHLEARLLHMEREWRFMHTDDPLKTSWQTSVADLERKAALFVAQVSGPAPVSLAAEAAAGHAVDPKATEAVTALLSGLKTAKSSDKPADRQAALQKLMADFNKQTEKTADLDVALAVFDAAVTQTRADPDQLDALCTLLAQRQLVDSWIETRFLGRLAARSVPSDPSWDSDQASRLLRIVQQTEQAFCHSNAMPWISPRLESAAQARHDAEYRFWMPGYLPGQDIEQAISVAEASTEDAAARQTLYLNAWTTYDQAMAILPWYSQYVDRYPSGLAAWSSAVNATTDLTKLFEDRAVTEQGSSLSSKRNLDPVRRATDGVESAMTTVVAPFASDSINRLVQRCQDESARPDVFREVDAVLATPLVKSVDRVKLWQARASLAIRLNDQTAQSDYSDATRGQNTAILSGYDPSAAMRTESNLAAIRVRVSLDLLRLGGAAVDPSLASRLENFGKPLACNETDAIAALWHDGLRRQIEDAATIGHQDRLSRIFPPLCPMGLLDNAETNPTLRLIMRQRRDLWAWRADRFRYETRDGVDPEFYAKLAVQFSPYLKSPARAFPEIDGPSELSDLVADGPPERMTMSWSLNETDADGPAVAVAVANPASPWLQVRPGSPGPLKAGVPVKFSVSLTGQSKALAVPPQGFLVTWSVAGRTYHRPVRVPALANESHLAVLLSPNAKKPDPLVDRIELRSHAAPAAFHLYVQNRGRKTETVLVELSTGAVTDKPLVIAPGQSTAVVFPPPAAAPPAAGAAPAPSKQLPELDGPLKVTVLDANQRELATAVYPVDVIQPRQFVTVDHVRFSPKDNKTNRLEIALRQAGHMPGPPCPVQLCLNKSQIPGLIGMGEGVFQGKLPAQGQPLTLFAKNLQLAEGVSEQGAFSLTIDGVPRTMVFDATFARNGGVTTPIEAIRPAMRLSAPPTAKSGNPFAAHVETDYAPESATLEVGLGRKIPGGPVEMDSVVTLQGGRSRRIGFSPTGKGGALSFDAVIADRDVSLDTSGIVGHRVVQARLLADDGRELAIAQQEVVLGDRPPQGVTFDDLPETASNKEPLAVAASARQSIPEISAVTFFVGKPEGDAIPKNAVSAPGKADPASGIWSGELALSPKVKGKLAISAQFTNAAGMSTFITNTINVTDADVGGGKIEGKVVEGSIPQAGIEVVLSDGQGAAKATAKTGADGSFAFPSLKPGKYVTSASKPTSGRRGKSTVEVSGKGTVDTTIELWL